MQKGKLIQTNYLPRILTSLCNAYTALINYSNHICKSKVGAHGFLNAYIVANMVEVTVTFPDVGTSTAMIEK